MRCLVGDLGEPRYRIRVLFGGALLAGGVGACVSGERHGMAGDAVDLATF